MKIECENGYHGEIKRAILELSDLDYLKDEFIVVKGSLGFDLTSKTNNKLSIHIGSYDIKYDQDISHLKMMVAIHRVYNPICILKSSYGSEIIDFEKHLPKTSNQLQELIDEFKYRGFGNVRTEQIIEFLTK
jgi:hypothetical protein